MRQLLLSADQFWSSLPKLHKLLSSVLAIMVFLLLLLSSQTAERNVRLPLQISEAEFGDITTDNSQRARLADYEYEIAKGDVLSGIFDTLRIPQKTMYEILETDLAVLALDTLKPGNKLSFWLDPASRELSKLEIEFSLAHRVTYVRAPGKGFEYNVTILPGDWQEEVLSGEVRGSFYLSAKRSGLTAGDIMSISALFKNKLNFNKGFRAGDQFQVVRAKQMVDGQETGETRVEAVRILNRKRELTAFLYKDSYYDETGTGLERAFSRYPLKKRYRISSPFNPKRRHPVTRLIRPHNGTDFATPIGTPIYSTGDGVVIESKRHPYAGIYIKIRHGQKYKTRYLHLSKSYVRKGQTVSRGQKIALSGNTGRSTGPHLHYELHINNRPVNAMSADIPIMTEIEGRERKPFKAKVAKALALMKANAS